MSIFSYLLPKKEKSACGQGAPADHRCPRAGHPRRPRLPAPVAGRTADGGAKYVAVDQDAINIQVDRESGCEILEQNITLPDE